MKKNLRSKRAAGKRAQRAVDVPDRQIAEPPRPSDDDAVETSRLVAAARSQRDEARRGRRGQQAVRVHVEPTDEERSALRRQRERERELREEERREGERHVLAYWRKHFGDRLPRAPVDDPWAVPIFKAGPAALLLLAPLNDAADAESLLRTVRPRGAVKPTLDELQMAAGICRWIGISLARGARAEWRAIAKAHDAIFGSDQMRRVAVLSSIEHLVSLIDGARPIEETGYSEPQRDAAREVREELVVADAAFAQLTEDRLLAAVAQARRGDKTKDGARQKGGKSKGGIPNKWIVGIATELSCEVRAFGDVSPNDVRKRFYTARSEYDRPRTVRS